MTNERQLYHSYHIENSKYFRSAEQETGMKIYMSFLKKINPCVFNHCKIFFNVDHFQSLYLMCYNIVSVLNFHFFLPEACEILAPQPGIKPFTGK